MRASTPTPPRTIRLVVWASHRPSGQRAFQALRAAFAPMAVADSGQAGRLLLDLEPLVGRSLRVECLAVPDSTDTAAAAEALSECHGVWFVPEQVAAEEASAAEPGIADVEALLAGRGPVPIVRARRVPPETEAALPADGSVEPLLSSFATLLSRVLRENLPAAEARPAPPIAPAPAPVPAAAPAPPPPPEAPLPTQDLERRWLHSHVAVSRIALEIGHLCMRASDPGDLATSALMHLVIGTEAAAGWVGWADGSGAVRCLDARGESRAPEVLALATDALARATRPLDCVRVGPPATDTLPGRARGGSGLLVRLGGEGDGDGWVLLVGSADRELLPEAASLLVPAALSLGLAHARLEAAAQLHALNGALQQRVDEQTVALRREKETLEERVKDRTRELAAAKRAALDAERRFADRERREGLHQVAAGVAHALNNPLGALRANLQFIAGEVAGLGRDGPVGAAERRDLVAAVQDAVRDSDRMASSIASLFGEATTTRRAVVATPLLGAAREAIRLFSRAAPEAPEPELLGADDVVAGVAAGELTRWIFRLLGVVGWAGHEPAGVTLARDENGPCVGVQGTGYAAPTDGPVLEEVRGEAEAAGGRLETLVDGGAAWFVLRLPPAASERRATASRGRAR